PTSSETSSAATAEPRSTTSTVAAHVPGEPFSSASRARASMDASPASTTAAKDGTSPPGPSERTVSMSMTNSPETRSDDERSTARSTRLARWRWPAMYDLLDLLEDITRPAYDGPAPLGFTSAYFTPDELLEARKELGRVRGEWSKDHPTFGAWMLGITTGWCGTAPGHTLCILQTDLRCNCSRPYLVAEWEKI